MADPMWETIFGEKYLMDLDPELEVFFIAVSLQHGTPLMPVWGVERARLASVLTEFIKNHPGKPEGLERVRRNYIELGGGRQSLFDDGKWFFHKVADAYLDWLYSQPASVQLQAELCAAAEEEIRQERIRREPPPGWEH